MTRRTLTIVIDANRVTCGECEYLKQWRGVRYHADCNLFRYGITVGSEYGKFRRCAQCLAAEREATG